MRYFFHIAYQGQHYNGWQKQPGAISVQGVIEEALIKILKAPIAINGCGRTDAQVHASQYFFHVDLPQEFDFDLVYRLNKTLPQNIAIFDIIRMEGLPHARFDAVQRQYDYFIHTYKDPFLANQSSFYLEPSLDLLAMKKAVNLLPLYKDYRAFCTQPNKYEHTICNVMEADLFVNEAGNRIRFHIASNRFLSKMIRILMGKLLKIGKKEMSVEEFEHMLTSLETPKILDPAHPTGLYLSKVTYPYLNLPPKTEFLTAMEGTEWLSVF
ncbi:tRNA pseudouridine(38-40) synthase TruA [Pedobacter sandarakinus]|uniref:tRNA pseudouridine(38-40) synthase TruA n=1 Tax=Pedobacter sandarakinus TaxID=353156 RepID=UPI002245605F|nr:tRNA pseudouridine(38-40) synthase TruA [Pedobacter sandarakinus]MCX2575421.1 tRNA pseudouridine(38-40) synthase TruA [Pedobacter sandarakinus]